MMDGGDSCALDPTSPEAREIVAFIERYMERWNAKDAAAVWGPIYRLDPNQRMQSMADLQALLDDTIASGWNHSRIEWVDIHREAEGTYLARIGYTRLMVDGRVQPPANRPGSYRVQRFADGLRITGFPSATASAPS